MSNMDHVIVLMLENRSFDHMLGFLAHPDARFGRLTGNESCLDDNNVAVRAATGARYEIASPSHSHAGTFLQLGIKAGSPEPTNAGFVTQYAQHAHGDGHRIMRSFDPRMIPVLSKLALEYAVCTRWFASVPGETWPNREFAHSATSRGLADIKLTKFESSEKTIFDLLDDAGASWRIYHDDTPHTWNYPSLWETVAKRSRFQGIAKIYDAIRDDRLPAYSFVEPDYGIVGKGNSQHPGQAHTRDEFVAGELLIHRIYDALRSKPAVFEKTVFVITYDEHGGFYDHVKPPPAIPPDGRTWTTGFAFDRLGVRVPAVIVSPWIERGTVDVSLYDHTSIVHTVRSRFASSWPPLTKRDAKANVFRTLLTRTQARTGSALPATRPLSNSEAAKLELELGAPLSPNELPAAEAPDSFREAMIGLSHHVGARLAAESPFESPGFDPGDPEHVLMQFRTSADHAERALTPDVRRRVGEAAAAIGARARGGGESPGGGGLESLPLGFESLPGVAPMLEAVAAAPRPEQELVDRVLRKLDRREALEIAEIGGFEAIVHLEGRPAVDIERGTFATPPSPWEFLAREPARARLEQAIACVGRIELPGASLAYAGTGFLVGDGLLMTNRHVASIFASGVGRDALAFKPAFPRVEVDLQREGKASGTALRVTEVVLIHPYWDLALLRVEGAPAGRFLTLRVLEPDRAVGRDVVAIGYPARDVQRNDAREQDRIFRDLFEVKRLSPGRIVAPRRTVQAAWGPIEAMVHDCSTLGGNSGSALVDVATGDVLGLHLGGFYLDANFACPAYELRRDPFIVAAGVRFTDDPVPAARPAWLDKWGGHEQLARVAAAKGAPQTGSAPGAVRIRIPIEITLTVGQPIRDDD